MTERIGLLSLTEQESTVSYVNNSLSQNTSEIGEIDERIGAPIVVEVDESKVFQRKYHGGQWREDY